MKVVQHVSRASIIRDYGDPQLFEVHNQHESLGIKSKNDGKVSREMKSTIVEKQRLSRCFNRGVARIVLGKQRLH